MSITSLAEKGLNLQAVFNLADLPEQIKLSFAKEADNISRYTQLILLGNGGKRFWDSLKESQIHSHNPVDDFCIQIVNKYFEHQQQDCSYHIIYPNSQTVALQSLGKLAGWHHRSPFMLGVNSQWGSWFAYRALILADTRLAPSLASVTSSPCPNCKDKPCIQACPAKAIAENDFDIKCCINYRAKRSSRCKNKCLSRNSCPLRTEHRYSEEQMSYHYNHSLQTIRNISTSQENI